MKISIVTISFNQGRFLEDCIRSILDQNYDDLEYIVVDPGSTDGSLEILARYADQISVLITEPDNGPADGLSKGLKRATGEILAFVNADDMLLPGTMEFVSRTFATNPRVDVLYGDAYELDMDGKHRQYVYSTPWNLLSNAYGYAVIAQPSTFFRRGIFNATCGINTSNETCWDAELFVDMALAGAKFLQVSRFMSAYRMYLGTVSSKVTWGDTAAKFNNDRGRIFTKIVGRKRTAKDEWVSFFFWLIKQLRQPYVLIYRTYRCLVEGDELYSDLQDMNLVWVGGFPAHYMRSFHRQFEGSTPFRVFYVYIPLSNNGAAFDHEQGELPARHVVLNGFFPLLATWRWLDRLNPKVILIAGHFPFGNIVAAIWAKTHGRALCYWSDTNPLDSKHAQRSWLKRRLIKCLLNQSDKLLFIGSRNRDHYMMQCGKDNVAGRLHRMPLPHQAVSFEQSIVVQHEIFTFLYIGRLAHEKGVEQLIRAFDRVLQDVHAECSLIIAGDGPTRDSLMNLTATLQLDTKINFIGAVPSSHVPAVFSMCDVVIVPSHDEPWGLVVNEALSSGKPVIAPFWVGSVADLLVNGKAGCVTLDNSPDSLSRAMLELFERLKTDGQMGMRGRNLVREEGWTVEGCVTSLKQLLHDLGVEN